MTLLGFPGGSEVKASAWNAGDPGSIPQLGRSPGEGKGTPLQYSCLENPMEGGAWQATVHGISKSRFTTERFHFHFTNDLAENRSPEQIDYRELRSKGEMRTEDSERCLSFKTFCCAQKHHWSLMLCVCLVAQVCLTLQPHGLQPTRLFYSGILQARILEWVAMPSSRGSSQPRDQTQVFRIAGRFFTICTTWESPQRIRIQGEVCFVSFLDRRHLTFLNVDWRASLLLQKQKGKGTRAEVENQPHKDG